MVFLTLVLTVHTAVCRSLVEQCALARAAWQARYPQYCRRCRGFGGRTVGNYPDEPDEFIPCADCLERGLCPRCGATGANLNAYLDRRPVCAACGWDDDDHLPLVAECYCD